jgi:hypothetical protein
MFDEWYYLTLTCCRCQWSYQVLTIPTPSHCIYERGCSNTSLWFQWASCTCTATTTGNVLCTLDMLASPQDITSKLMYAVHTADSMSSVRTSNLMWVWKQSSTVFYRCRKQYVFAWVWYEGMYWWCSAGYVQHAVSIRLDLQLQFNLPQTRPCKNSSDCLTALAGCE